MKRDDVRCWLDQVSAEECNEVEGGYLPLSDHEIEIMSLSDEEYDHYRELHGI
jgi:hypothetical protein